MMRLSTFKPRNDFEVALAMFAATVAQRTGLRDVYFEKRESGAGRSFFYGFSLKPGKMIRHLVGGQAD
jgi:hypothetical protein